MQQLLNQGGLMRCCTETWQERFDKDDLPTTLGARIYCNYGKKCDPMKLYDISRDGSLMWMWDKEGPPNPLMIGQTRSQAG